MKKEVLYHGSKIPGIKVFEPQGHFISKDGKIVFATSNKSYALAMIYGTGDELAVSYAINPETSKREVYIDELEQGKLNLLDSGGYLYKVSKNDFELSPEGLESEYISYKPVQVLSVLKIDNILGELRKSGEVNLVTYENVLESMKNREETPDKVAIKHSPNRFK